MTRTVYVNGEYLPETEAKVSIFDRGFLMGKAKFFPYYRFALYAHMVASPVALLAGLYQFAVKGKWHRQIGLLYVLAVLGLAAPSGLMMSFYAIGGLPSTINFLALSWLWGFCTYAAYVAARRGDWPRHQRMMTRSFILTNSAVLIRLFSFINHHFHLTDPLTGYVVIAYISWLPWWGIYEGMLWWKSR